MAFSIGLRLYKISIIRKRDKVAIAQGPGAEPCDLFAFAEDFVTRKHQTTVYDEQQRTWFFERSSTNAIRTIHGYINYGTHGFESKFKDVRTRAERYQRKSSDLEEIPLYFQIWVPKDEVFALIAFQSFQGRSCVGLVRASMREDFEEAYPGYTMNFNVVAASAAFLDGAPVKSVTFHRPKLSSDKADGYLGRDRSEVEYDVTLRARRRGDILSTYKELRDRFPASAQGFVEFDGHEFESVRADVQIGAKRRSVGVFGTNTDMGLIDISSVDRSPSGHPVLASIEGEVNELMEDFFVGLKA